LTGLWLNLRGREAQGIVDPAEAPALREELCRRLSGLKDENGTTAVNRVFDAHKIYVGPYKSEAPDLIMGYNRGYRVSWEAAIGQPTDRVFHDNTKAWSGDHIVDPKLVPGVLFCNRKLAGKQPHITDLGPTVLDVFGVEVPQHMDGRPLVVADFDGTFPGGGQGVAAEPAVAAAT
jgi:predicted AlkP superfamily phosphohydrolase/phosphomutase